MENVDLSVVVAMLIQEYGGELRISRETIESAQINGPTAITMRVDPAAEQWVFELEKLAIPGELVTEDE
jgi:hypothetical protein